MEKENMPKTQITGDLRLMQVEARIELHLQGAYGSLLEVGRCLVEAKEEGLVPHGQWEEWVRTHAQMTERQAQRLMQAARAVPPGSAMAQLPLSKIQRLLSLPEEQREDAAQTAVAQGMSLREVEALVRQERAAAAQEAEQAMGKKIDALLQSTQEEAEKAMHRKVQEAREKERASAAMSLEGMANTIQQLEVQNAELDQYLKEARERLAEMEELAERQAEERDQLRMELQSATAADGIDEAAREEIDRLHRELADMEAYADRQAEERQKAQQAMLEMESQRVRIGAVEPEETLDALSAARSFLGKVGYIPHMGAQLHAMAPGERRNLALAADMVGDWVEKIRKKLNTIVIEAEV